MKKIISYILVLCIICIPVIAHAETKSGTSNSGLSWTFDADTGILTVSGKGELDQIRGWGLPFSGAGVWSIKKVILSEGITKIGKWAFDNCYNMEEIVLPKSLISIDKYGISDCRSLKTLTLPNGLVEIKESAFSLTPLESIHIPKTVEIIEEYVFPSTLKEITVDNENNWFCSVNGILYNKSKTQLIKYPGAKLDKEYIMPEETVEIFGDGYIYSDHLESLYINKQFKEIDELAENTFWCPYLKKIEVSPENPSFTSIHGILFSKDKSKLLLVPNCLETKTITLPRELTSLPDFAFSEREIEQITIPQGISIIPAYCFAGCKKLENIYLPKSITNIEWLAFEGANSLKNVYYEGNLAEWNKILIERETGKEYDTTYVGNSELNNAAFHYNYIYKSIDVSVSSDKKMFLLTGSGIPEENAIILALYTNKLLKELQMATYKSGTLTFTTDIAYTEAKIMVWDNTSSLYPYFDATIFK